MAKIHSSKLQNYTVYYHTKDEFHHLKREIFTHDSYYFESENATPHIIDAGAHIGLATLYFKKIFPGSKITAIEPNPITFELLEKNIFENQLQDVTTINAALAEQAGEASFYMDSTAHQWWSTASFIPGAWTGDQDSRSITVPTLPLTEVITEPVDFLKMDIEGAEYQVLMASQETLPLIKRLHLEFHPHSNQDQFKLVKVLNDHFELTYLQDGKEVELKKVRGLFQIKGVQK